MDRAILAVVLVAVAVLVALVLRRRTAPRDAVQGRHWTVPAQVDRRDFTQPEAPWLVVEFSSASCDGCAAVWDVVRNLQAEAVAVQDVSWPQRRDLHQRYGIDAAPTVIVVDGQGAVRASFVGRAGAGELPEKLAELTAG